MKDTIILVASTDEHLEELATDLAEAAANDDEVTIIVDGKTYYVSAEHVIVPLLLFSPRHGGMSNMPLLVPRYEGATQPAVVIA